MEMSALKNCVNVYVMRITNIVTELCCLLKIFSRKLSADFYHTLALLQKHVLKINESPIDIQISPYGELKVCVCTWR